MSLKQNSLRWGGDKRCQKCNWIRWLLWYEYILIIMMKKICTLRQKRKETPSDWPLDIVFSQTMIVIISISVGLVNSFLEQYCCRSQLFQSEQTNNLGRQCQEMDLNAKTHSVICAIQKNNHFYYFHFRFEAIHSSFHHEEQQWFTMQMEFQRQRRTTGEAIRD